MKCGIEKIPRGLCFPMPIDVRNTREGKKLLRRMGEEMISFGWRRSRRDICQRRERDRGSAVEFRREEKNPEAVRTDGRYCLVPSTFLFSPFVVF